MPPAVQGALRVEIQLKRTPIAPRAASEWTRALAEVLGVRSAEADVPARLGPPRISQALAGVRFVLAAQVVFNHVGTQEHGSEGAGTWGAVGAARFFCVHVPCFYALAAFSLSASMGPWR